jgi:hypothetical protein
VGIVTPNISERKKCGILFPIASDHRSPTPNKDRYHTIRMKSREEMPRNRRCVTRLTEGDAEVAEGAAGDGHVDGELGVAEGGEERAEPRNGEGHDDAGPGVQAGGAARGDQHPGTDHAADAQPDQVPPTQRARTRLISSPGAVAAHARRASRLGVCARARPYARRLENEPEPGPALSMATATGGGTSERLRCVLSA